MFSKCIKKQHIVFCKLDNYGPTLRFYQTFASYASNRLAARLLRFARKKQFNGFSFSAKLVAKTFHRDSRPNTFSKLLRFSTYKVLTRPMRCEAHDFTTTEIKTLLYFNILQPA